jgi:hypothetical protein
MADPADHQGRFTDFLSRPPLVGACGLGVSTGAPLQGCAWHGLTLNSRLTEDRELDYYAQNTGDCDYPWDFSEKSLWAVGNEAFGAHLVKEPMAPGAAEGSKLSETRRLPHNLGPRGMNII